MTNTDLAAQIVQGATERLHANKASDTDRLVILLAHHEDRCDERLAEAERMAEERAERILDAFKRHADEGGASKKALAGIGATAAAIIAGAAEGLRRVVG